MKDVSYIVENDLILNALEEVCSNLKNVTVKYESRIKKIVPPSDKNKMVHLEMENGDEYTCNLLVRSNNFLFFKAFH